MINWKVREVKCLTQGAGRAGVNLIIQAMKEREVVNTEGVGEGMCVNVSVLECEHV